MWPESIWIKSVVGLLLGFLVSMSVFINIGFVAPIPADVFLLTAVLGGFIGWALLISWFFCVPSIKRPTLICLGIFVMSSVLNAWFYMERWT